jgi:hypothetical protein
VFAFRQNNGIFLGSDLRVTGVAARRTKAALQRKVKCMTSTADPSDSAAPDPSPSVQDNADKNVEDIENLVSRDLPGMLAELGFDPASIEEAIDGIHVMEPTYLERKSR